MAQKETVAMTTTPQAKRLPYTWDATVEIVRADTANRQTVQFGGTDRAADEAEAKEIGEVKVAAGIAQEFPGYRVVGGSLKVWAHIASDAGWS